MEKLIKIVDDIMVAITFAEAGEFDEANRVAGNKVREQEENTAVLSTANK